MISPQLRGGRDVLRVRLRLVQKRTRCRAEGRGAPHRAHSSP
jgi:hypothetical protein